MRRIAFKPHESKRGDRREAFLKRCARKVGVSKDTLRRWDTGWSLEAGEA
jgi:hypothetical protein